MFKYAEFKSAYIFLIIWIKTLILVLIALENIFDVHYN